MQITIRSRVFWKVQWTHHRVSQQQQDVVNSACSVISERDTYSNKPKQHWKSWEAQKLINNWVTQWLRGKGTLTYRVSRWGPNHGTLFYFSSAPLRVKSVCNIEYWQFGSVCSDFFRVGFIFSLTWQLLIWRDLWKRCSFYTCRWGSWMAACVKLMNK